jgi:O-acetyl-ADP-ribose deacetylase (regulator of RNase III)
MTTIQIVSGDIAKVPADALIAARNSFGLGPGHIDLAITNVANDMFHPLVPHNLRDGQSLCRKSYRCTRRRL